MGKIRATIEWILIGTLWLVGLVISYFIRKKDDEMSNEWFWNEVVFLLFSLLLLAIILVVFLLPSIFLPEEVGNMLFGIGYLVLRIVLFVYWITGFYYILKGEKDHKFPLMRWIKNQVRKEAPAYTGKF